MVGYTDLGDVNNQLLKFERFLNASTTSPNSAQSTASSPPSYSITNSKVNVGVWPVHETQVSFCTVPIT